MKTLFKTCSKRILAAGAVFGIALFTAYAQYNTMPTYESYSASGTSSSTVLIPHQNTAQTRVLTAVVTSDLATSTLKFYSGTNAYSVKVANTNTSATDLIINSTNGMGSTNVAIYIGGVGAGSNVVRTIAAISTTNIVGNGVTNKYGLISVTAALGFAQTVGDEVELLGNVTTLGVGANTNKAYAGEALYVGRYGRAVYVVQTGTSACSIDTLTVHFDGQSQ